MYSDAPAVSSPVYAASPTARSSLLGSSSNKDGGSYRESSATASSSSGSRGPLSGGLRDSAVGVLKRLSGCATSGKYVNQYILLLSHFWD
jgi:hypothetical protein